MTPSFSFAISLLLVFQHVHMCWTDAPSCEEVLMSNLADSAFTATSNSETVDHPISGFGVDVDYSAKTARDILTGGWCPATKVSTNLSEFIQVDMGSVNVINKIAFGPRSNVAHAPSFVIRYKRESGGEWRDYKQCSSNSTQVIQGADGNLDLKLIALDPPFVARWIRIYPFSRSEMYVCMKFQLYGCQFIDELVEYKIPDGGLFKPTPFSPQIDLRDRCYDGARNRRNNILHDGVGCLTDLKVVQRKEAGRIFETSPWQSLQSPSTCLVGWNRSQPATENGAVEMIFRFSGLRNFSSLSLFPLDIPLKKIRPPKRLEAAFSIDGTTFPSSPDVQLDFQDPDTSITVGLQQKSGRALQLKLYFDADWLILSEIRLVSVPGDVNRLDKALLPKAPVEEPKPFITSKKDTKPNTNDDKKSPTLDENDDLLEVNAGPIRAIEPPYQGSTVLVLILVFLCCFMLLLVGIACFSIAYMQKRKKRQGLSGAGGDGAGSIQTNGKLIKAAAAAGTSGLFRWPGLTIGTNTTGNTATQQTYDNGMSYVSVPNTESEYANSSLLNRLPSAPPLILYQGYPGGGYFASPSYTFAQNDCGGPATPQHPPLGRRLLNSVASRLFKGKLGGSGDKHRSSSSAHQYEQVVPQSAHSSPVGGVFGQPPPPPRNDPLPPFPVVTSIQQQQLPNSVPVHAVNGLIQIDLKQSHPSLIVNGHPVVRLPHQSGPQTGSDTTGGPTYFSTLNTRHLQQQHQRDSSVVYQSVHGESDADSLAASTMSPEYASASLLGGQPGGGGLTFPWPPTPDFNANVTSVATSTGMAPPPLYLPQHPHPGLFYPGATFNGGGWTPQMAPAPLASAYLNRSISQQQFHPPFWSPQPVSQAAALASGLQSTHPGEVTSSTHSGESSDRLSGRQGTDQAVSAIYGFPPSNATFGSQQ